LGSLSEAVSVPDLSSRRLDIFTEQHLRHGSDRAKHVAKRVTNLPGIKRRMTRMDGLFRKRLIINQMVG